MQQNDYILREIEKLGLIFNAIRQKLFGGTDRLSVNTEKTADDLKEMLADAINFDIDRFINIDDENVEMYLSDFNVFSNDNLENFADCLFLMGRNTKFSQSKKYLNKSLQIYEMINTKSKIFSIERDNKIKEITNILCEK